MNHGIDEQRIGGMSTFLAKAGLHLSGTLTITRSAEGLALADAFGARLRAVLAGASAAQLDELVPTVGKEGDPMPFSPASDGRVIELRSDGEASASLEVEYSVDKVVFDGEAVVNLAGTTDTLPFLRRATEAVRATLQAAQEAGTLPAKGDTQPEPGVITTGPNPFG